MRKQANLERGRLHQVAYFSLEIQYHKKGVCGSGGEGVGLDHSNGYPTPAPNLKRCGVFFFFSYVMESQIKQKFKLSNNWGISSRNNKRTYLQNLRHCEDD